MADAGDKSYQCPVCWREFTKPHSLKIHLRIHTGEKPFRCTYCPKAFTTSGNLSDHLRVHSTARTFECHLCGAKFKRNATLKRHLILHSKYTEDKKNEDKVSMVLSPDNDGEMVHSEDVNEHIYLSKIDRTLEIIASEQSEAVQTEIVHHPSHVDFDDLQEHRSPTIQLLLPPGNDREGIIQNHPKVKEEKLDDFYDATFLELTEELDIEGGNIKVYSYPEDYTEDFIQSQPQCEKDQEIRIDDVSISKAKSVADIRKSDRNSEVQKDQVNPNTVQLDISNRFGGYVTKILRLLHSKEKQVLLIKELNRTIHDFHVENR